MKAATVICNMLNLTSMALLVVACLISLVVGSNTSERQLPPGNIIVAYVDSCDNNGHDAIGEFM